MHVHRALFESLQDEHEGVQRKPGAKFLAKKIIKNTRENMATKGRFS